VTLPYPCPVTLIATFSDVHGNTPALIAVLDAVDAASPDRVVNLGDIASGGVDPRGTLDILRSRKDILTVRGNHERQLLTRPVATMGPSDRLAHACLTPEDRDWLVRLPTRVEPVTGVLAFHGAPEDDLCYLLETVTRDGLREATDGWLIHHHAIDYDIDAAASLAERNGRPDVVRALRTGRV
jgi:3',5'-cyclic AMP phosphodiesterase CpdA